MLLRWTGSVKAPGGAARLTVAVPFISLGFVMNSRQKVFGHSLLYLPLNVIASLAGKYIIHLLIRSFICKCVLINSKAESGHFEGG